MLCRYPMVQKSLVCLAVSTEYRRVTDGQTDRRTDILRPYISRYASHRAVKTTLAGRCGRITWTTTCSEITATRSNY